MIWIKIFPSNWEIYQIQVIVLKIVVDSHTHSISSGHAYSTVQEMAQEAPNKGIEMFALTDHGPAMKGAPFLYHFGNLKTIPDMLYGVRIIKGAEVNILNASGEIDLPDEYLHRLDFVLAGFHDICIEPTSVKEHTETAINILKNPLIDTISHPGNPQFQVDIDKFVLAAKEYAKPIEINNHSFHGSRVGSADNCYEFARKCKQYKVPIICGSDSHISFDIGKFDKVYELLKEVSMPEELILNRSVATFEAYLKSRQKVKGNRQSENT